MSLKRDEVVAVHSTLGDQGVNCKSNFPNLLMQI